MSSDEELHKVLQARGPSSFFCALEERAHGAVKTAIDHYKVHEQEKLPYCDYLSSILHSVSAIWPGIEPGTHACLSEMVKQLAMGHFVGAGERDHYGLDEQQRMQVYAFFVSMTEPCLPLLHPQKRKGLEEVVKRAKHQLLIHCPENKE